MFSHKYVDCTLMHWINRTAIVLLLFVPYSLSPVTIASAESIHSSQLVYSPIGSQSEKSFHLVFPPKYRVMAQKLMSTLDNDYQYLTALFGEHDGFRAQVQLMDSDRFYATMKVPKWTNAIYLRSRIVIPIKSHYATRGNELERALLHELVHAVIDHETGGRCPGWLDEGLAQLLEGPEHPILRKALQKWVRRNGSIPFSTLKTGFTKLPKQMVPAAYAESLYSTKFLLASSDLKNLRMLFTGMRNGKTFAQAFENAFHFTIQKFESELQRHLRSLAHEANDGQRNPIWQVNYEKLQFSPAERTKKASIRFEE